MGTDARSWSIQRGSVAVIGMNPAIQTMRAAAFLGGLWLPLPAVATDPRPELMVCMTPREARAAVGNGRAVAFASVKREAETSSGARCCGRACARSTGASPTS
jgi:hypothetical protein